MIRVCINPDEAVSCSVQQGTNTHWKIFEIDHGYKLVDEKLGAIIYAIGSGQGVRWHIIATIINPNGEISLMSHSGLGNLGNFVAGFETFLSNVVNIISNHEAAARPQSLIYKHD